ncbi:MAG: EamA family transporter RarD [Chthoniobacterales bacterium]
MSILPRPSRKSQRLAALLAAVAAFVTWGLVPLYWKLLKPVPATEILAHRFVWTMVFLIAVLSWQERWPEVRTIFGSRRTLIYCFASGVAIATNWFLFIWAVNADRVVESSLGYFMIPLVNVLLGAVFLRERLTLLQFLSVVLAAAGVLNLTFGYGRFPWVAVALCVSFGLYGLLRKKSGTAAIPGLFFETASLLPLAVVYLLYLEAGSMLFFGRAGWLLSILLVSTGVVTAVPLFWFGYAARYLPLTTLGFLQYLSPTGTFLLGVFLYHEPFTRADLITFALIWAALGVFTSEALLRWRSTRIRQAIAESACEPV